MDIDSPRPSKAKPRSGQCDDRYPVPVLHMYIHVHVHVQHVTVELYRLHAFTPGRHLDAIV